MGAKKTSKDKKSLAESYVRANEMGTRRAMLEDIFSDLYTQRRKIYWFNLVRGIFFGFGSVLGGTLIVTIVIAWLNLFSDVPGGIGDFVQRVIESMQR